MACSRRIATLFIPSALLACTSSGLDDARTPTGSRTIAASSDYRALYVASEHDGVVSRLDLDSDAVDTLEIGGEPSRVAVAGGRVLVTLRGERAIAVLRDHGGELSVDRKVSVGTEPVGIAAREDGTRIYVAESTHDRVSELDGETLEVTRSWEVAGQPRWLALHPSGRSLFAASAYGGRLTRIALDDDQVEAVALPDVSGFSDEGEVTFTRRFTGDPAFTPDGEQLLVPALFVDDTTVIVEGDGGRPAPTGGYDRGGRFNPAVVMVPVGGDGVPQGVEKIEVVSVNGSARGEPAMGYPASVSVSPDGMVALVTIEGAAAVVALSLETHDPVRDLFDVFAGGPAAPSRGGPGIGFAFRPSVTYRTGAGPNGAAFLSDEEAFTLDFIDRKVGALALSSARRMLGFDVSSGADSRDVAFFEPQGISQTRQVEIAKGALPAAVERGRRMFFAANDSRVATVGAAVSCATCHFHGRDDGLSWPFSRGARQTPSLAGRVSLTEPVRWGGDRATVAEDAMMTSQGLMGGRGLANADSEDMAAFIDWTRDADHPLKGAADARVERGRTLFESPALGCATCHAGERYTDNRTYRLLGIQVQTRALTGVAVSAPYYHDGSAPTLRDVVISARQNGMGNTSGLSEDEIDDLVYYLRSL